MPICENCKKEIHNHKWAVAPWGQAQIAILRQFADQRLYTEIAVRDALKEQHK